MVKKSILFRCDGSPQIGLGHVVRCLALADELSQVHHAQVAFAMRQSLPAPVAPIVPIVPIAPPIAIDMVRQKGYPVLTPQADDLESAPPPQRPQDLLLTSEAAEQPFDSIGSAATARRQQRLGGNRDCQPGHVPRSATRRYGSAIDTRAISLGSAATAIDTRAISLGWLEAAISQVDAAALILDVRPEDDLSRQGVDELRRQGVLIVTLDDPSERRLAADLAFYPPVPQVQRLDWGGFNGQLYTGWEWVVLRKEFAHRPSPRPFHEFPAGKQPLMKQPLVLVTMGGSDPAGLTLKTVEALDLLEEEFETVLVPGPAFIHHEALENLLTAARRSFRVISGAADLPGLMAQADLAVCSFGVTAYELASLGVPAIYLCLTDDQAESASCLVEAGLGNSLGVSSQVSETMLTEAVRQLLARVARGEQRLPKRPVDGRGAERIARIVAERMEEQGA